MGSDIRKAMAQEEALIDEYEGLLLATKKFLSHHNVPLNVRSVINVGLSTVTGWVFEAEARIDELADQL
jgi:hypothetical protein